jgi:hypothetical protein
MRLLLAGLLLIAMNTARADWVKWGENDQFTYYTDDAQTQAFGDLRRIIEMQDRKTQDSDGMMSQRAVNEYDCRTRRQRVVSAMTYSGRMGTGKVLSQSKAPSNWYAVTPGTAGEAVLKFACGK